MAIAPIKDMVESILWLHPPRNTGVDGASIQAAEISSICNSHNSTIVSDNAIVTAISDLLCRSRPAAIPWLVMAVVIYAIYRVSRRRPRANVCKKSIKALAPLRAHHDAASPIIFVRVASGVEAPVFYMIPRLVLWRAMKPVSPLFRSG
jgi:hypothetical protein